MSPINAVFRRILLAGLISLSWQVYGLGASIDLPGKSAEEATEVAKKALKRLDVTCNDLDITLGAHWRCKTPFYSFIGLDVFVSTIPEKSIIRADARNRQSFAFVDLVANELGQGPYEKKYGEKSLLFSTAATLVSPGLGYLYANTNSMIRNKSIFLPVLGFLFGDLALFWMSSKIYFTNGFDPFGAGLASMLISMGAYRFVMLLPVSVQVLAHNRFAGLQITFRY